FSFERGYSRRAQLPRLTRFKWESRGTLRLRSRSTSTTSRFKRRKTMGWLWAREVGGQAFCQTYLSTTAVQGRQLKTARLPKVWMGEQGATASLSTQTVA